MDSTMSPQTLPAEPDDTSPAAPPHEGEARDTGEPHTRAEHQTTGPVAAAPPPAADASAPPAAPAAGVPDTSDAQSGHTPYAPPDGRSPAIDQARAGASSGDPDAAGPSEAHSAVSSPAGPRALPNRQDTSAAPAAALAAPGLAGPDGARPSPMRPSHAGRGARSGGRVHRHYGAHRRHYAAYLLMRGARERRQAAHRTQAQATWGGVAALALLIVGVLVFSVRAALTYYQAEDPTLASLQRTVAARDSVRVYDSRGVLLYQFNRAGAQHSIPLARVPTVVVNATIATEDHDFWSNQGVDFRAIARAAYTDATAGQIQEGASTITQQLIKQNVLTSDPTFTRKIQEVVLALGLTAQGTFSKAQILQMYLNSIPYGPTSYGIDAAATTYFGYTDNPATGETAAQHLDLAQATMLAGIPKSPAYNDPLTGPDGLAHARARQLVVLDSLVQQGYITPAQANAAWQEAGQPHFFHPQFTTPDLAPHFVDYIEQQLDQMVSAGQLHVAPGQDIARTGLDVYTTLDLDLQNHVQQSMLDHLCGYDLNDYPGSPNRYIRDDNVTNAAAVVADQHTGAIRVLLGSMDYYGNKTCHPGVNGQFDVATQGYRGPGSSFKPIDYATAFEQGWSPATIVRNEPTQFWDPGTQTWYKPHDADNNHLAANMTVRNALQLSQNIPAVETMAFAGVQNVAHNAELWGIHDWQGVWGLSSAIGSLDVHPIDMVQVYTVFANYGLYIPLHAIDRITDPAGNAVYQYQQPKPVRVLSPQVAFLLTSILSDNPSRIPEFNVCSPMYLDPSVGDCYYYHGNSPHVWPAAAKTGTGDDLTNDWTMGYTMDYTMGVWVGNNDFSPMQWVDGVTGAAPIWYHSMLYAERNLPQRAFPVPSGVRYGTITSHGIRTTDWFIAG